MLLIICPWYLAQVMLNTGPNKAAVSLAHAAPSDIDFSCRPCLGIKLVKSILTLHFPFLCMLTGKEHNTILTILSTGRRLKASSHSQLSWDKSPPVTAISWQIWDWSEVGKSQRPLARSGASCSTHLESSHLNNARIVISGECHRENAIIPIELKCARFPSLCRQVLLYLNPDSVMTPSSRCRICCLRLAKEAKSCFIQQSCKLRGDCESEGVHKKARIKKYLSLSDRAGPSLFIFHPSRWEWPCCICWLRGRGHLGSRRNLHAGQLSCIELLQKQNNLSLKIKKGKWMIVRPWGVK